MQSKLDEVEARLKNMNLLESQLKYCELQKLSKHAAYKLNLEEERKNSTMALEQKREISMMMLTSQKEDFSFQAMDHSRQAQATEFSRRMSHMRHM